jgi:hypothetical protein
MKTAETSSEGWFSFDADYADYLANGTAPWVADGDAVKIEARDAVGRQNSSAITTDLLLDKQETGMIELR